jgi:hypothetical protein
MVTNNSLRGLFAFLTVLLLGISAGCGSGSKSRGGNSGPNTNTPSNTTPSTNTGSNTNTTPNTSKSFTLGKSQVDLAAFDFVIGSAEASVQISINNDSVASVEAGYLIGDPVPSWLQLSIDTISRPYQLKFVASPLLLKEGTYKANVVIATKDKQSNVLDQQTLPVTFTVRSNSFSFDSSKGFSLIRTAGDVNGLKTDSVLLRVKGDASWVAKADQPWVKLSKISGTGTDDLNFTVDTQSLAPGDYAATVMIEEKDQPLNRIEFPINVTIGLPKLVLNKFSVLLGGDDGLASKQDAFTISTNTGPTSYPLTITTKSGSIPNWLSINNLSNSINDAEQTIELMAKSDGIAPGIYQDVIYFSTNIVGYTLIGAVQVTFNVASHHLIVDTNGISFTQSPSLSAVSRSIAVSTSQSKTVPLTASADQSWLSVSPSGSGFLIEAKSDGLLPGNTYTGTVRITSSDPTIENEQIVRVGFTLLASDPAELLVELPPTNRLVSGQSSYLAANPVEPLVFTNVGTEIQVFNIYSGEKVRSFSGMPEKIGGLSISGDGLSLFVYDLQAKKFIEFDSSTGAIIFEYSIADPVTGDSQAPLWMAVDGKPVLLGAGQAFDLTNHKNITPFGREIPAGPSLVKSFKYPEVMADYQGRVYSLRYSSLTQGKLAVERVNPALTPSTEPEGQACFNNFNSQIYVTPPKGSQDILGYLMTFPLVDKTLKGGDAPNSLACSWNGLLVSGASVSTNTEDLKVFNVYAGVNLQSFSSSTVVVGRRLVDRAIFISNDALRFGAISENAQGANQLRIFTAPKVDPLLGLGL